jgi:hypothetical protein
MTHKLPIRAGVFDSQPQADSAVTGLLAAGFDRGSIRVVSKHADLRANAAGWVNRIASSGAHTPRALVIGALAGGVLAALIATVWFAPTEGEGLIVAGAWFASALGGGLAGAYIGAMMTRGFEPAIADFHDQAMGASQVLVAVNEREGGPPLALAVSVLERLGATALWMRRD